METTTATLGSTEAQKQRDRLAALDARRTERRSAAIRARAALTPTELDWLAMASDILAGRIDVPDRTRKAAAYELARLVSAAETRL